MAAPSGTVWGNTVGGKVRLGICVKVAHINATHVSRSVEIWFWSKYAVHDSKNTLYYDHDTTSATTERSTNINIWTNNNSGSGWGTDNQLKLATYNYNYAKGLSTKTYNLAAKLKPIEAINSSANIPVVSNWIVPAVNGAVRIYNGSGWQGAIPFVYNNGAWRETVPYVYNGSAWQKCR